MKYNEILNLSEVLKEGFFADRVVRLLNERKLLGSSDEKLLKEILNLIKKARKGEHQVESGKLGSNALDSIGAYHRAISIIALQSISEGSQKSNKKVFDEMLKTIESEVGRAIERKMVDPPSLKQTLTFFEFIKRQTLSEASRYYSRKVEVVSWPALLY